jgi:acylphosphatase
VAEVIAYTFVITGRVQGVGFRAATRREAQRLDVAGYAINRDDGSVEVRAQGEPSAVDELARWLGRGPAFAAVSKVVREDAALGQRAGFGVG